MSVIVLNNHIHGFKKGLMVSILGVNPQDIILGKFPSPKRLPLNLSKSVRTLTPFHFSNLYSKR